MDYLNSDERANTDADPAPTIDPERLQNVADRLAAWAATLPPVAFKDALP